MKRSVLDVLLVEDDGVLGGTVAQRLRLEGLSIIWTQTVSETLDVLEKNQPTLMLCDIRLPDGSGHEIYRRAGKLLWETDVIFATAYADIEQAVELVKTGASDYLVKPYDINDVVRRIKATLSRAHLPQGLKTPFRSFHYESLEMTQVVSDLKRLAKENFSILLIGESGTGKEMAARLIHEASGRQPAPFIPVCCADISETTLESKYFGHEAHAFPGADTAAMGVLEQVGTGTLFLDEVCEMHPKIQIAFARMLQDGSFRRLGSIEPIAFRGRIVAATNAHLDEALESGKLRQDLYYRLQNAQVTIPPLRERISEILPLAEHFLDAYSVSNPLAPFTISDDARRALLEHTWPGNVRELMNRIVQACTLANSAALEVRDLFPDHDRRVESQPSLLRVRQHAEREEIERVIAECGGRLGEAAKKLGISRTTLWKRRRELNA